MPKSDEQAGTENYSVAASSRKKQPPDEQTGMTLTELEIQCQYSLMLYLSV